MSLHRRFLPLGLVALVALAALAVPAAAQPAPLPTWTVGNAVGYGTNLDLTALAAPFLQAFRTNQASYNITSIQELNFTGSLDAWVHQTVQSKTDTYYVLATETADGLRVHFVLKAAFDNLPAPGTYTGNCSSGFFDGDVQETTRTVEVTLDVTSLVSTSGTSRWSISDVALMQSTDDVIAQTSAHAVLKGLPMSDVNLTACQETITYEDRDLGITVNTHDVVRALFSPALDVFDFPINPGEDWWASATATVGANVSGTINVVGLSAADEEAFFENLTAAFQSVPGLAVTGLDHLPIDLAQITVTVGGVNYLQGGILHDTTYSVEEHLQAKESNMTLADGNIHEVFLISTYQDPGLCLPTLYAVYSVDDGMIVGYQMYLDCSTSLPPVFELKPVSPAAAQDHLQQTETNYNPFPPAPGNAIVDFFVAAPYWGILLLVIAAVAVAAFFLVRRRGRRMAPPMPPQVPPPPAP